MCGTGSMSYRTYRSVRYRYGCTERTDVSGAAIDVITQPTEVSGADIDVPNLTKCSVPVLMYRTYRMCPVPLLMSYPTYRGVRCHSVYKYKDDLDILKYKDDITFRHHT